MSNLPLNIAYLLKRLVPDANYVLNGRNYEDIIWMDQHIRLPSKQDLENEFLRIEGLNKRVRDKDAEIKELEQLSNHDLLKRVIASAEFELAKSRLDAQQEKTRVIREHEDLMRKENEEVSRLRETLSELRLEHVNKKQSLISEIELLKAEIIKIKEDAPKKVKAVADKISIAKSIKNNKKPKPVKAECGGFHNYIDLRNREMPSKEEIAKAIKAGKGAQIMEQIQEIHDKYPKPKKKEDWR